MEYIRLTVEGPIAVVTIHRPACRNALISQVYREISAALQDVRDRDDVRVVLLTGAGDKAFAAGADIAQMVQESPQSGRRLSALCHEAAELLETILAERIERIESERSLPRPDEVLRMAQRYKKPSLCNAYCARACPIGQEYVPEIKPNELPAIVLEMLATLNTLDRERGCLIDISADGSIDPDELADFLRIQRELEQISRTVEALQLWAEKMMADGRIDRAAYTREISAAGEK